jgi:surfactin synthase thioesterase subunit
MEAIQPIYNTYPHTHRKTSVIAFHHAGGSIASFLGWQAALGTDFTLVPVRITGPSPDGPWSFSRVIDVLDAQLAEVLAGPHVLFGQSMGAVIAYQLACRRAALGMRPPERFLAAACLPPRELAEALTTHQLGRLLSEELSLRLQTIPSQTSTTTSPAHRLRDHLEVLSTYVPDRVPRRLDCRFDVFVGNDDHLTSTASSIGWATYTRRTCHVHLVEGGHLFRGQARKDFLRRLRGVLSNEQTAS